MASYSFKGFVWRDSSRFQGLFRQRENNFEYLSVGRLEWVSRVDSRPRWNQLGRSCHLWLPPNAPYPGNLTTPLNSDHPPRDTFLQHFDDLAAGRPSKQITLM